MQMFQKVALGTSGSVCVCLLVATVRGQDRIVPELPQASSPVTLVAASDPVTGKSEFRYRGNNIPPVIRVQPGKTLKVEYKNELPARSKEDCFGQPCMDMTNLHFHGLHVSPDAPQDDVLTMLASPGETLDYSVQVPPQEAPGLYWYHTHPHGESYIQDLDGMSGAIVVEGIERYVPELLNMRERILVLRDLVLPTDAAQRKRVMESVSMQTTQCGSAPEKPERAFTVNGSLRPQIDIAPRERQFWRIVNASPDRYADLEVDSVSLDVVALDGIDIVSAKPPNLKTRPGLGGAPVYITFPPKVLKRVEASEPQFVVNFTEDKQGFYINGKKFEMNAGPMLTVDVGSLQHWRVLNPTREVHPFHIHQVHFLVYAVDNKPVKDPVWLDTVNVSYGSSVDLVMDFTDPIIRGMSVFHCHLLSHEDKGMMAKILFR